MTTPPKGKDLMDKKKKSIIDTKKFIEDFEKEKAKEEEILSQYERINTNGAVLIDGNHVLLEVLNDIDVFNNNIKENPMLENIFTAYRKSSKAQEMKNIWGSPDPVHVADYVGETIRMMEDIIPHWVIGELLPDNKRSLSVGSILSSHRLKRKLARSTRLDMENRYGSYEIEDPENVIAVDMNCDITIFDAELPKKSNLIKKLETRWETAHKGGNDWKKEKIQKWLDLIKSNKWRLWAGGGYRELPFDFKNTFLEVLGSDILNAGFNKELGNRKIDVKSDGDVFQSEKGVDSRFVIAGCDLAEIREIDWVLLITNDGDYVPLIDRLKERGKEVFIFSWGNPNFQSRELVNAVGDSNAIPKHLMLNNYNPDLIRYLEDPSFKAEVCNQTGKDNIFEYFIRFPAHHVLFRHCLMHSMYSIDPAVAWTLDPKIQFEEWKEFQSKRPE